MSEDERKTAAVLVRMTQADRARLDATCKRLPMVAQKRGPLRHPTAPEVILDLLRRYFEAEDNAREDEKATQADG